MLRLSVLLAALVGLLGPAAPAQASMGTWDRAWGKAVDMTTGGDLCTAASGDTCQAGTAGGAGGQMNNPTGVATDAAGNVYVVDWVSNNRIEKFDSSGAFISTWGKGVDLTHPGDLCTAASGDTCQAGTTGGAGGQMNGPIGVATDASGSVYVADMYNHRIDKFTSSGTFISTWGKAVDATTGGDLCTAASGDTCQAGTAGGGGGQMNIPKAVATDAAGNVYDADSDNNRIDKFTSSGTFISTWGKAVDLTSGGDLCTAASGDFCHVGTAGGAGGGMDFPQGVTTSGAGDVYVADQSNNRIDRFTSSGAFISTWGKAVDATSGGDLCTAASGDTCQFGTAGWAGGQMYHPIGVATDAAGNIYVGDTTNNRIEKFTSSGAFISTWGKAVDVTSGGDLCTAASGDTCQFGTAGGAAGQMNPRGIATDAAGNLYVPDYYNNRIQKFHDPALSVSINGAGTVTGGGISCPGTCSQSFLGGTMVTLTATPSGGHVFAGWTGGGCAGTGTCTVPMSSDRSVTANFTLAASPPPYGTKISKAKIKKRQHNATLSFSASGSPTGFECALVKQEKKGKHAKKPKLSFSPCSSPKTYKHLKPGKYTFEVQAVNSAGPDPSPAVRRFRI